MDLLHSGVRQSSDKVGNEPRLTGLSMLHCLRDHKASYETPPFHFTVNEHIRRVVPDISWFGPFFPSGGKIKVCTLQFFVEVTHIKLKDQL